jgi:hypothetical protein
MEALGDSAPAVTAVRQALALEQALAGADAVLELDHDKGAGSEPRVER